MTEESKPQDLGMDPHGLQSPSDQRLPLKKWNPEFGLWSLRCSSLLLPCSREFVGLFIGFSGPLALSIGLS